MEKKYYGSNLTIKHRTLIPFEKPLISSSKQCSASQHHFLNSVSSDCFGYWDGFFGIYTSFYYTHQPPKKGIRESLYHLPFQGPAAHPTDTHPTILKAPGLKPQHHMRRPRHWWKLHGRLQQCYRVSPLSLKTQEQWNSHAQVPCTHTTQNLTIWTQAMNISCVQHQLLCSGSELNHAIFFSNLFFMGS